MLTASWATCHLFLYAAKTALVISA